MSFQIGDKVVAIDEDVRGRIIGIVGDTISMEADDGFVLKFFAKELVKITVEQSEIAKESFVPFDISDKVDYQKGIKQTKTKRVKDGIPPMEVDLHIDKLTKSTRGLDNYDMLALQMDTAKYKLEFAIRNRIQRVVFIHGVGEGVLKEELGYLLRRYNVKFYEASYQKYGMGATEVYITQNVKD